MAHERPRGAPIHSAPAVTKKDETIMGKMPKEPLVGAHLKPKMMLLKPAFRKRGKPSTRMKRKIRRRNRREENAKAVNTHLTKCSLLNRFLIIDAYQTFVFQDLLAVPGEHPVDERSRVLPPLAVHEVQKGPHDPVFFPLYG